MDKRYFTQWSGQFLAAGELSRRGYIVTFTMGNAPRVDFLVKAPSGMSVGIQVKSQRDKAIWQIGKDLPPVEKNLFWILVYIPKNDTEGPHYLILTNNEMRLEVRKWMKAHPTDRSRGVGFQWGPSKKYRSQWEKIPR